MGLWIWVCILLCVGVGYTWILKKKKKMDIDKEMKIPKGNLGFPLIGETLDFIACGYTSRPVSFMDKRKLLYGNVFKTNILGCKIIVSTDPEVNKVVLQNHGNMFIPAYPKSITELLGKNSILHMNGNLQKKLHSLVGGFLRSPHFKCKITRDIEHSVKFVLDSWRNMDRVVVQDETKKITFPILVKVLMGVDGSDELDFLKREFEEFIKGLICIPVNFPGTRLYKSLKAKERMMNMVSRIVHSRKTIMEKSKNNYHVHVDVHGGEGDVIVMDAVDLLLRDSQSLTVDFIANNIIEMMIPGEETLPTAMTLAVKFLSDSRVALEQLTEENMELKMKKSKSGDDYSWVDYMSLPFTQNVISETLRMANIINGVWRKALKDVEIKGYLIPRGWCVLSAFISVHMAEEYYQHPYHFNPSRWENMNTATSNNNFTPFGGGQRLCPGLELSRLELSIFLHHLVTTYSWVAENDEINHFPTVKMKKKLPITVKTINRV